MRSTRIVRIAALGVLLGALPSGAARAQDAASGSPVVPPALETYYTQIRFGSSRGDMTADGIGARLLWNAGAVFDATSGLARHLDFGLFGTYTPKRTYFTKLDAATYGFGVTGDARLFTTPYAGHLDPFASLGVGLLATHVSVGVSPAPSSLFSGSRSSFLVAPGVGLRLWLAPFAAVQGDVRDDVTVSEGQRNNLAYGAGIHVAF
jgi:hypothetical protein